MYCIVVSIDIAICSNDVLTGLNCFLLNLRLTICQDVIFFLHCHENSYLLFHPRFSVILFIFLVFKLIVFLYG